MAHRQNTQHESLFTEQNTHTRNNNNNNEIRNIHGLANWATWKKYGRTEYSGDNQSRLIGFKMRA